jgi:hypothetical protein
MKLLAGRNMFHGDSLKEIVVNQTSLKILDLRNRSKPWQVDQQLSVERRIRL